MDNDDSRKHKDSYANKTSSRSQFVFFSFVDSFVEVPSFINHET
jgi:hypothetical protein